MYIEERETTRIFDVFAGNANPGDVDVKISVRSPCQFTDVQPGTDAQGKEHTVTVKKSGSWLNMTIPGRFQGGPQREPSLVERWNPGVRIVTFTLKDCEAFVGKEAGAGVSTWPDRNRQRNSFGPQSPDTGDGGSPWDPLNPNP